MLTAVSWLGFLSDEQRTGYHGRAALARVEELTAKPATDLEAGFVAANLLALLLFRTGKGAEATRLCRAEIDYALRRRHTPRWPLLAMFALQPQINLFRMQGYASDAEPALEGLRRLERIGLGLGATLPELELNDADVARMVRAGLPVTSLARNVAITDACKILWRHGMTQRLLSEAERLDRAWPSTGAQTGPQHAAEAPWLIDALAQSRSESIDSGGQRRRRLAYNRLLHLAAHAAAAGQHELALDTATALYHSRHLLDLRAGYASALTPLRCLGSLADTLLQLGRTEFAEPILRDLLTHEETSADSVLSRGIAERLGAKVSRPPDAESDVLALLDSLLTRLD